MTTIIITDQYNNKKTDAKVFTNNNLMAKKRKMYLYKRNATLESKVDGTATGSDGTSAVQMVQTNTTTEDTTSQLLQTAATTNTIRTTFPSDMCSSRYCSRVPFDNEHKKVLPHYQHQVLDDFELYPKALRLSVDGSPPTLLMASPSSNRQKATSSSLSSSSSSSPSSSTPHWNYLPCGTCTKNCHSCCSPLTCRLTALPETKFGRQRTWFPSKNSYYFLSETNDTNIGNASINKAQNQQQQQQQQHCAPTSDRTASENTCFLPTYCIKSNHSNCSQYCYRCHSVLRASATETRAATTKCVCTNLEPSSQTDIPCSSNPASLDDKIGFSELSLSTTRTSLLMSSTTTPPPTHPHGHRRRRRPYMSQLLQHFCMKFKMLFIVLTTLLQHPRCSLFDTPSDSSSNSSSRSSNCREKRHRQQHHCPQLEQRLMTTHFKNNDEADDDDNNKDNNRYVFYNGQNHQRPLKQAPHPWRQQRKQMQYPANPILLNASYLNTVLLGLSFLSLCFVSSSQALTTSMDITALHASVQRRSTEMEKAGALVIESPRSSDQVHLNHPEKVCKSIDIRNSPSEMRHLENCTVIEGFLLISLISGHPHEEYNQTFPLLTEVTDYILVYQVSNLLSLGQIFPNLRVIRGRSLFEGYALLVIFNSHLEELALPQLTSILRGGVRIEKNDMLCYVKTIDWTKIVSNSTDIYIEENRDPIECPACPGEPSDENALEPKTNELDCKLHQNRRLCWSSKSCQIICPERCRHNCIDENTCCSDNCLGGCSSPENVNQCITCRKYSFNNTVCTHKCPENFFIFMERRCVTADACREIGTIYEDNKQQTLVPINGQCTTKCPIGYVKDNNKCVPCVGKCIKKCKGTTIDGAARAKEFHDCNYVDGSVTINIKRASQIRQDLEYSLSSIETISGYLKVHGTYGMFDLRFFKNLKTIKGEQLFEEKYAFYVLENTDLEAIWNVNQSVRLENGTVYFHFNPKLCITEIHKLLPMMRNQTSFDKNEVAEDSNGSKGSCNISLLDVRIVLVQASVALVNITNPIKYEDERTFIGFQFLIIEDPYNNATKHGFRPCDDGWLVSEPSKDTTYFFQSLKPYTRYAFYSKTMTISSERRNAQSNIQHFTTLSDQPSLVGRLQAYANSSSDIVMSWLPPVSANGNLTEYKIRAVYDNRDNRENRENKLDPRNYCKDPLKVNPIKIDKITPITTSWRQAKEPSDCKCSKTPQSGGSTLYTDEAVDANIHANIELENALMNFVYVKKDKGNTSIAADMSAKDDMNRNRRDVIAQDDIGSSFMLRHIRAAPTTFPEVLKVEEKIETSVNATTYEYVFNNLKHFSWYALGIRACRESEPNNTNKICSEELQIYVRTLKLDDVDKVKKLWATPETTNSSRASINLSWIQPENPNGAVVSYTILYELQASDEVEEKKCVTEIDYLEMDYQHHGYAIKNLQSGNYSIRIQTNTLAGEGLISDKIYVYLPPTSLAPGIIAGIVAGSIVLILLIAAVIVLVFRRKILIPPTDLSKFPYNPHYISLQYIPDEWEVAREHVIQLSALGQGSFGMVYEGILKNNDDDVPCAIKTVNENATDRERMNFLNEACVMKQFDTYHVVHLLGVCSRGQPALVIMELMKNGDLKSYLRAHRPDDRDDMGMHLLNRGEVSSSQPPPLSRIYQMAIEIADGMAYLAAKKFVHRDLAARNCMVAADLTVKIGDFGMTRDIYENDYYRKGTKGLLPVRWMPPESLRDGVYSTSSDVFSYGVVLWEMATLASQPYQGLANDQVLRYVIDGGVMERPENCPDKLYILMQKCWQLRPTARPTFVEIIRYLYDLADPHFREVSFYNSEEGQHILAKEISDGNQRSGDVFDDLENDMEDATIPLRLEEYSNYKLNMDNNSSVGPRGGSMVDAPHSPYSMGSPMVVSSTPDEQSRGSYHNMSRILHPHSHMMNSAPSTSAGLKKLGSSSTSSHLTYSHTHPNHRNLYQPTRFSQQSRQQHHSDDMDAYVQPDFGPPDDGIKRDSEEQGYEIYDPSPNYSEHVPGSVGVDDDEDDFGVHSTAGQNLLVRPKGRQKQPSIMPLSTSMPDDVIGQQVESALHPSTASAASSNASSKAGTAGKYPSLKAVADSARLRMMNMRLFKHNRSGSNASHKSTSSNPTSSTGVGGSINNLSRSGRGKSMSGQNLGTIESGGSGSAGSYTATPRFFSPSSGTSANDNTQYRRLGDSVGDNSITGIDATHRIRPRLQSASAFMMGSSQPNYRMLDESLNTTGASVHASNENPNYEIMQPGGGAHSLSNEATSSYVMMNEPAQKKKPESCAMSVDDTANYQMMSPLIPTTSATIAPTVLPSAAPQPPTPATTAPTSQPVVQPKKFSSSSSAASTSSSNESEKDDDLHTTNDIKLERMPLSRRSSNEHSRKRHAKKENRSRSQSSSSRSSGKSATNTASSTIIPTPATTTTTTSQTKNTATAAAPSSTFSRKEKWFKEQQQQQQQQQPQPQAPPNGFVGREA